MSEITEVQLMRFLAQLSQRAGHGNTPSLDRPVDHTDTSSLYDDFSCEADLFELMMKELPKPEDEGLKDVIRQIAEFLETQTSTSLSGEEGRALSDFVYPVV